MKFKFTIECSDSYNYPNCLDVYIYKDKDDHHFKRQNLIRQIRYEELENKSIMDYIWKDIRKAFETFPPEKI